MFTVPALIFFGAVDALGITSIIAWAIVRATEN